MLDRLLQAGDQRSAQEVVEACHLLGNQVVGNDGDTERATGDLPRLPCMPIAEPSGVPQFLSNAYVIDLFIEESIQITQGILRHEAADGTPVLVEGFE